LAKCSLPIGLPIPWEYLRLPKEEVAPSLEPWKMTNFIYGHGAATWAGFGIQIGSTACCGGGVFLYLPANGVSYDALVDLVKLPLSIFHLFLDGSAEVITRYAPGGGYIRGNAWDYAIETFNTRHPEVKLHVEDVGKYEKILIAEILNEELYFKHFKEV